MSSVVWRYFSRKNDRAYCIEPNCTNNKDNCYKTGTSGPIKHLERVHPTIHAQFKQLNEAKNNQNKSQDSNSITGYLDIANLPFERDIAELVTSTGVNFNMVNSDSEHHHSEEFYVYSIYIHTNCS
jgi:hypothetical protein